MRSEPLQGKGLEVESTKRARAHHPGFSVFTREVRVESNPGRIGFSTQFEEYSSQSISSSLTTCREFILFYRNFSHPARLCRMGDQALRNRHCRKIFTLGLIKCSRIIKRKVRIWREYVQAENFRSIFRLHLTLVLFQYRAY
jgi:hypothetical protein